MAHAKPAHPPLPEPAGVGEAASRQRLTWAVDAAMSVLPEADPEVVRACLIEVVPSGRFGPLARQVVGDPSLLVSGSAHSTGQVRQLIAALQAAQVPGGGRTAMRGLRPGQGVDGAYGDGRDAV